MNCTCGFSLPCPAHGMDDISSDPSPASAGEPTTRDYWREVGDLFKSGGMYDPAFLFGMIRAERELLEATTRERDALRKDRDELRDELDRLATKIAEGERELFTASIESLTRPESEESGR